MVELGESLLDPWKVCIAILELLQLFSSFLSFYRVVGCDHEIDHSQATLDIFVEDAFAQFVCFFEET